MPIIKFLMVSSTRSSESVNRAFSIGGFHVTQVSLTTSNTSH